MRTGSGSASSTPSLSKQGTDRHPGRQAPLLLAEVELSRPLAGIPSPAAQARRVRVLVRLHSHPLGTVDLSVPATGLDSASLRAAIWDTLWGQIRRHLAAERPEPVDGIPVEGFGEAGQARCSWRAFVASETAPRATIVVTTCGGREELLRTIASALDQDYPNFDVTVVDNRPAVSGVRSLLSDTFPDATRLCYTPEPRQGLGRARNAGLHSTTANVVAFTDDDVVLDPSWLSWLVAGFGASQNVACVTGLILPLELETPAQLLFDDFAGWSARLERRVWTATSTGWTTPFTRTQSESSDLAPTPPFAGKSFSSSADSTPTWGSGPLPAAARTLTSTRGSSSGAIGSCISQRPCSGTLTRATCAVWSGRPGSTGSV